MEKSLHQLTPRFILQQHAAGRGHGSFQAAALFLDISGFTAVTEALMQQGKAGAEALADVMQDIFTPLIEAIYAHGGFITGFAGDAFTALFPGHDAPALAQAVRAAHSMRRLLAANPMRRTPYGNFRFTGKVGLAAGSVNWGILGNASGYLYYFRGAAIDGCAAAEHLATGGDVVLAAEIVGALSDYLHTAPISGTIYHRLLDLTAPLPMASTPTAPKVPAETAVAFQPEALLKSHLRGEFRQVVSVFVNLQGSPTPEALATFITHCQALARQYGGYLYHLDFGDKGCNLPIFWGAPTGHENDIERALNFLLDLRAVSNVPLRAGITYRQVFAGFGGSARRAEYTCYGLSVNQAARQMMAAEWGQLWLDAETARRAMAHFDVVLIGEFPFKGFTQPQPVFALRGRRETIDPLYRSRFAGRSVELARLAAHFEPLANGRFGGVTIVTGEAGIGKSRLVHEVLQRLPPDWRVFTCQADEILRRPFNPFRYWLRRYFRQPHTRSTADAEAAFTAKITALQSGIDDDEMAAELERIRSFLGALIDLHWPDSLYAQLEPELRLENTLRALKTLLRAEAKQQPVVLLVEDGQWLDEASRTFLQRLPRSLETTPLSVVITSRDEQVVSIFDEAARPEQIEIGELATPAIRAVTESLLGHPPAPSLIVLLQARAEGNPFFLEQILLYLQEQGALTETAVGWKVTTGVEALPGDVQAVLVARLDRLTQSVREVVQTAAVLGREFEIQVLAQMLRNDQDVIAQVSQAETAAIWSALSELIYQFRHALLRDTAYQMQLRSRLRRLHHSAAQALERLHAGSLEAYALEIGYHFEQAGDIGAAIPYWRQAATAAQQTYQNEQALALLAQVLAHVDRLPPADAVALWQQQAEILTFTGNFDEAETTLHHALPFAEEESDALTGRILNSLGHVLHARGEFDKAESVLARSLNLLAKVDDKEALAVTYRELGNTVEGFGNFERATTYYQEGMEVCRTLGDVKGQAQAHLNLGAMCWNRGDYDGAEARYRLALTGFEEVGDVFSQGKVHNNMGSLAWARQDMLTAQAYFEQSYAIMRECGSYVGQSITLGNLGSVNQELENFRQAAFYHERSLEISEEAHDLYSIAFCRQNLASTYRSLGQNEKAVATLRASLETALQIKADAIVLNNLITVADMIGQEKPERAFLLLSYVKEHPACYENMVQRVEQTEADLPPLTAVAQTRVAAAGASWPLPDLAQSVLAADLPLP